MIATKLTEWQEQFVLSYVYNVMDENWDRDPSEVVNDEHGIYRGDWDKYASDMASWHSIKFCSMCNKVLQAPRIKRVPDDNRWCSCT